MKSLFYFIPRWFGTLLLFLLSLTTLGVLIWTSNKGFDITDQGIYLVCTQFPSEVKINPSAYYMYTAGLYVVAGYNVIALRIIAILSMLGSAALFFFGLYYLLKNLGLRFLSDLPSLISAWSLVSVGALLHYAGWLLTPGYNLINAVALNAGSGFLFFGLALLEGKDRQYKLSMAAFCAAGLCIGISLFVKFSTGIILFIIFSSTLAFWPSKTPLIKIKSIISVGVGVITWMLIHFAVIQSPVSWWEIFHRGVEYNLLISPIYGWGMIERYGLEFYNLFKTEFITFWKFYFAVFIGLSVLLFLRKSRRNWTYLPIITSLMLFITLGWKSYLMYFSGGIEQIFTGNLMMFYMFWLIALLGIIIVTLMYCNVSISIRQYDNQKHLYLIGITLLVLPFAGAIGTGTPIYMNIYLYLTPWFALLMIFLMALSLLHDGKWIFNCGACLIVVFACSQIILGVLTQPYRLSAGMLEQKVSTDIGMPSTRLLLDPATSDFFKRLHTAAQAHGFKPGDDVLAFYDLAGVVFALGGRSPCIPQYTYGLEGSDAANEMSLFCIPKERIKKAYIMQNVTGKSSGQLSSGRTFGYPDLARYGINFPVDYILCGEAISPYYKDLIRLWKPKNK